MESITAEAVSAQRVRRASELVVEAVAAKEGCDPIDLRPPLFTAIDPDTLDALLAGASGGECSVSFVYGGHDVVVDRAGSVSVDGA